MKDIRTLKNAWENAASVHYPNRTRLYDLYEYILKFDGHLTGIMARRISAVRNKKFRFVDKEGKQIEGMESFLQSKCFRDILTAILQTPAWGITALEFDLFSKMPRFEHIPRKHVKPEYGTISVQQQEGSGYEYKDIPEIWVIGEKQDYGYLLTCAFYALIKRGDFSDWAQYVELFGQPMRVAKYDAYDVKTKSQLKTALDEAGSSLSLMIPKQAEVEIIDGKQSNGDGKLQQALKDSCNDEMSLVVLTNTETTTGSNGGSLAKAKEQGKQQLEITKDDIEYTLIYLNDEKFLSILANWLPVEGGHFEIEKELNLATLATKVEIDAIVSTKVPVGDDYWYETYGIPKPDNYDELKAKMEAKAMHIAGEPEPGDPADPINEKKKPEVKPQKDLSAFDKLRFQLADFFDRAHKD
jgi:hypothetical protein